MDNFIQQSKLQFWFCTGSNSAHGVRHEMVKHTQTICQQNPATCLSVFDHFVRLALKGLILSSVKYFTNTSHQERKKEDLRSIVSKIYLTDNLNQEIHLKNKTQKFINETKLNGISFCSVYSKVE